MYALGRSPSNAAGPGEGIDSLARTCFREPVEYTHPLSRMKLPVIQFGRSHDHYFDASHYITRCGGLNEASHSLEGIQNRAMRDGFRSISLVERDSEMMIRLTSECDTPRVQAEHFLSEVGVLARNSD